LALSKSSPVSIHQKSVSRHILLSMKFHMPNFLLAVCMIFFHILTANGAPPPSASGQSVGTLTGKVLFLEDLSRGGVVSFFIKRQGPTPDQGTSRRIPDRITRLNPDGNFSVKLSPGAYYMGAMQWYKGRQPGPPREGEKFIFIRDAGGTLKTFEVTAGEDIDIGEVTGSAPANFVEVSDAFTIRGVVTDENSTPFTGAVVILKYNLNSPRPVYVSKVTGEDGKYEFSVPAGTYFVIARQQLSKIGRPRPGTYMGAYGEQEEKPIGGRVIGASMGTDVTGKQGDVYENINIMMFKLPEPEARRQKIQDDVNAQKIEKKDLGIPPGMKKAAPTSP
jgi:hypothetical protein